ncbi:MAG: hypothetical protein KGL39_50170 [Patescibacteria group bacterium]|nr:hypothetical protein [Patescibacteria group bacterium]
MTQPAQRRLKQFARRQAVRFRALERSCVRDGKVMGDQVELWGMCRQIAESFERLEKRAIIAAMLVMLSLCAGAQPLPPLPTNAPPLPPPTTIRIGTNTYRLVTPVPRAAITNILLSWSPYTNFFLFVDGSTNLVDWYRKTNLVCLPTNALVPVTGPREFYRIGCDYKP